MLDFSEKVAHPPKIFHVNWFRKDENGEFIWPGFGENLRVLNWIIDRVYGRAPAVETPIGFVPTDGALDLEGLDIAAETIEKLFAVNPEDWLEELKGHRSSLNSSATGSPS